jgi:hypothetical protein
MAQRHHPAIAAADFYAHFSLGNQSFGDKLFSFNDNVLATHE